MNRRGAGIVVVFAAWVITLALIWGLVQGQAQSGALTAVVRVNGLRTVVIAGQSALTEAGFVLTHPPPKGGPVLQAIQGGTAAGTAHAPAATRALYADEIAAGHLKIEDVTYRLLHRGAAPKDRAEHVEPWVVELAVRVTATLAGQSFTRTLRRRHLGRLCQIYGTAEAIQGKVLYSALAIDPDPVVEVVDR